jgi:hypothetical protein
MLAVVMCDHIVKPNKKVLKMEITNEQIDRIFSRNSKFIARRALDKSHYEVVEMMNEDWEDVITDDQEVRSKFATYEEAETLQRRLHVRWILST